MENFKVYYGEYNLQHWIKLILKKDIELPSYQRNFVWTEDKVIKLMESLKSGLFVPPVVIGTYFEKGQERHYIIDGQQRLSAVLLAYLKKFPNKGFELNNDEQMADDNDDNDALSEDDNKVDIRNWKLTEIQKIADNRKDREYICRNLKYPFYKDLELEEELSDDFFDKTFIGFSYIKPNRQNEIEQKRYYSSIFRNINVSGQILSREESRSSLYWLDSRLEEFFKPASADRIIIDNNKIDFARYLAFVAEFLYKYKLNGEIMYFTVAKGYGTRVKPYEEYIENFVYHCVGERKSTTFLPFDEMFQSYEEAIISVKNVCDLLLQIRKDSKFVSIIDADYYLFGLIFWKLYMGRSFDEKKFGKLNENLNCRINKIKKDAAYLKRPSAVGRVRERLFESASFYEKILME